MGKQLHTVVALASKSKMYFVDGTLNKLAANSPNLRAWIRCDSMLIGWFTSNFRPLTARSIQILKTTRDVLIDLEERFGQSSVVQLNGLKEEWAKLNQDLEMTMAEYFTKEKVIWDEIDAPIPFQTCSCTLTQRSQVLMMLPLPQITYVYRLLLAEQKHKDVSEIDTSSELVAFAVDKRRFRDTCTGRLYY